MQLPAMVETNLSLAGSRTISPYMSLRVWKFSEAPTTESTFCRTFSQPLFDSGVGAVVTISLASLGTPPRVEGEPLPFSGNTMSVVDIIAQLQNRRHYIDAGRRLWQ